MKKQIAVVLATGALVSGALAQGSINVQASLSNFGGPGGITTQGGNATSSANATTWLNPLGTAGNNFSLSVYYVTSANYVNNYSLSAINSLLNTTGGATTALTELAADGFALATASPVLGNVNNGAFNYAPSTVALPNAPTSGNGYLALYGVAVGGTYNNYAGVIAFANAFGGSSVSVPAGTPATLAGWNTLNENLVLSPVTPVPEPATMALAALGGASLLLFRRRK